MKTVKTSYLNCMHWGFFRIRKEVVSHTRIIWPLKSGSGVVTVRTLEAGKLKQKLNPFLQEQDCTYEINKSRTDWFLWVMKGRLIYLADMSVNIRT